MYAVDNHSSATPPITPATAITAPGPDKREAAPVGVCEGDAVAEPIPELGGATLENEGVWLADAAGEEAGGVAELDAMRGVEDAKADEVGECAAEAYLTVTVKVFGWARARGATARVARRDFGVILSCL